MYKGNFSLAILLILVIILVACGGERPSSSNDISIIDADSVPQEIEISSIPPSTESEEEQTDVPSLTVNDDLISYVGITDEELQKRLGDSRIIGYNPGNGESYASYFGKDVKYPIDFTMSATYDDLYDEKGAWEKLDNSHRFPSGTTVISFSILRPWEHWISYERRDEFPYFFIGEAEYTKDNIDIALGTSPEAVFLPKTPAGEGGTESYPTDSYAAEYTYNDVAISVAYDTDFIAHMVTIRKKE